MSGSIPLYKKDFTRGSHLYYELNEPDITNVRRTALPEIVWDLLDIAACISWADRQFGRPKKHNRLIESVGKDAGYFKAFRGWVREFHLTIAVRRAEVWNTFNIKKRLEEILHWLTEDYWKLTFVVGELPHEVKPPRYIQSYLPTMEEEIKDPIVVLFSGGLDSLAGVVNLQELYKQNSLVLISTASKRLEGLVNLQGEYLEQYFSRDHIRHIPFSCYMRHMKHEIDDYEDLKSNQDSTQRARGFLFFASGVAMAVEAQARKIMMCENGIGMLNLPYNKRQLGALNTRAVHPRTLIELNELLELLSQYEDHLKGISYEAPFFKMTKGEMCQGLQTAGHGRLCAYTSSCDSFPLRWNKGDNVYQEHHCGTCTSCLLRRLSIYAAGLQDQDHQYYKYDICQEASLTNIMDKDVERELEPLKMMLDQCVLFERALNSEQPTAELLYEFPELVMAYQYVQKKPERFGLQEDEEIMDVIVDLVRRYVKEWEKFPLNAFNDFYKKKSQNLI